MPDVNKLEARARKLIEAGLQELEEQDPDGSQLTATGINRKTGEMIVLHGRGPSLEKMGHCIVYADARDLLLKEGFERRFDPEIRDLYFQLIPPYPPFQKEKRSLLSGLRSRNEQKRFDAARTLERRARLTRNRFLDASLKDPDLIESVMKVLERDQPERIQTPLIHTLGSLYNRFVQDRRIPEVLVPFLHSESKTVLEAAVLATSYITTKEKWKAIYDLLSGKPVQPTLRFACQHCGDWVTAAVRRKLVPLLSSQ